jgi:iron complex outermembrane recepter protein
MTFLLRSLVFKLNTSLFLLITICLTSQTVWANEKQQDSQQNSINVQLTTELVITEGQATLVGDLPEVHTTIQPLLAQDANSVKITGVKVNPTATGVEILLESTSGTISPPTTKREGNTLTADIPNAILTLPEGKEFQSANPAKGIANVVVTQVANQVRISITGTNAVPAVNFVPSTSGLMLSLTASEATESEEDEIEVVVTGEQQGYRVPNATTATKTDTPLRDIPANIQVIPRQLLQDQGATRIGEAVRNVSGVNFSTSFGNRNSNFNVRGFTASQFRNGFLESTSSSFFNKRTEAETADLEQIEVLKGPASVLFGQGDPGGIINLVPKKPLFNPFYEATFTAGSYSFYRPTIDLTGPLSEDGTVAYRLNLAYENAGSFRDFINTERFFIAPTLTWKINPNTSLTLEASYLQDQRTFDRGTIVLNGSDRPADLPFNRAFFDPANSVSTFDETRVYFYLDHKFDESLKWRSAFRFTKSFESGLTGGASQADELLPDNRTLVISNYTGDQYYETYTFQNDLTWKFNTGSIAHTLLFGLELAKQTGVFSRNAFATGGLLDIFNPDYNAIRYTDFTTQPEFDGISESRIFGIYLQDQIALFDNLKLIIGGRFDTYTNTQTYRDPTFNSDAEAQAFSPRLGIVYQPTKDISLYASYTQSFNPVSGRSESGTPFLPERGTQYEIGLKADLFDGRLSTTLSAYDITKSNVLTADPNNPNFSIQIGEQKGRGIDFDIVGKIMPGWDLIASYAYTDARISKDNSFPVENRLNNVPKNTASLFTTYRIQEGDLKGLGFGAGVFYVDSRAGDLENSFTIPSYTRVDAALYYEKENFRAALNFKNLFNARYFDGAQNRLSVIPGAPFTVQATVSWKF